MVICKYFLEGTCRFGGILTPSFARTEPSCSRDPFIQVLICGDQIGVKTNTLGHKTLVLVARIGLMRYLALVEGMISMVR